MICLHPGRSRVGSGPGGTIFLTPQQGQKCEQSKHMQHIRAAGPLPKERASIVRIMLCAICHSIKEICLVTGCINVFVCY
jgi:hypothetical protein